MAANYLQADRPLQVSTPLGKDVMLATAFVGSEGLSQLFRYTVDTKTVRTATVAFDAVMGQGIGVLLELPGKKARYFHGICVRLTQGESDSDFTDYQLEVVPQVWVLTKKSQSRIFQHVSVPDILKKVFAGFAVEYQISGTFEKRDFCVQYRETDFNFACRLMEEEGIFYFFKHEAGKHTMVVANTPQAHPAVPGKAAITYKNTHSGGLNAEDYITEVAKVQEQTSGKFVLWDHTFELPHQHNESEKLLTDAVTVGKVAHRLRVGDNGKMEVYDWPGEYAQRFDGISETGGEQPAEVGKISPDSRRTTDLRMQMEAAIAVRIQGTSGARQLTSGHKFSIATLATDLVATPIKCEGEYVVTTLSHAARMPSAYRSGEGGDGFSYSNTFTAIPSALPFRPQRTAAKPVVSGTQSAVVVGPTGEEIFTDKYGRIKVQFHWDREGRHDAGSSCWVRVAHLSAGRQWGFLSIPRIGQEVIIDFQEGDPDQPICLGCVYNPDQMPKYKLPDEKTKSYIRTNSSMQGVGYNELRFEDKKDKEQIYIHAQKNMDERVRNDSFERIGNNRHLRVGFYLPNDHKGDTSGESKKGSQFEEVAIDQHLKVHNNKDEQVGGDMKLLVGGIGSGDNPGKGNLDVVVEANKHELIGGTSDLHVKGIVHEKLDDEYHLHVKGDSLQTYDDDLSLRVKGGMYDIVDGGLASKVGTTWGMDVGEDMYLSVGAARSESVGGKVSLTCGDYHEKSGMNHNVEAAMQVHMKAGMTLILEAGMQISLKVGGSFIDINPTGIAISGPMVLINSGGAAGSGSGAKPDKPQKAPAPPDVEDAKDAARAKPVKPADADKSETGKKSN